MVVPKTVAHHRTAPWASCAIYWYWLALQACEALAWCHWLQVTLPPTHELHDPVNEYRYSWADYSANDAKATWQLRESLYR
jgi:hypothetical protein